MLRRILGRSDGPKADISAVTEPPVDAGEERVADHREFGGSASPTLIERRAASGGLPRPQPCDFVAIDFETANETRSSACAVGVALVRDGEIAAKGSTLIDPQDYFNLYNVMIHGVDEELVRGAPTLADLWPQLTVLLEGQLVVAHNASFDMSVLRNSAARWQLEGGPSIDLVCTYRLAKKLLPGYPSYSLGYLAPALGIVFDHHEAGEDASACAELATAMVRHAECADLRGAVEAAGFRVGHLDASSYLGFVYLHSKLGSIDGDRTADEDHPLYAKSVCFTGAMASMLRREAAELLVRVGGDFRNSVSKQLDYLVIGDADFVHFADGWQTGKLTRATELVEQGAPLEIIPERTFLELLFHEEA